MNPTILIVLFVATSADPSATGKAAEAYARQERLGERLDAYYHTHFDEGQRKKLGFLASAATFVAERRVVLRWEF